MDDNVYLIQNLNSSGRGENVFQKFDDETFDLAFIDVTREITDDELFDNEFKDFLM